MEFRNITSMLTALEKVKAGLDELAYQMDVSAGDIVDTDDEGLQQAKAALEQSNLDARQLADKLVYATAAVASLAYPEPLVIEGGDSTLSGYNLSMSGKVHALAGSVSALMAHTLRGRGFCACDSRGTCAAHAEAWNEMQAAEQHLTKAAKAFILANKA